MPYVIVLSHTNHPKWCKWGSFKSPSEKMEVVLKKGVCSYGPRGGGSHGVWYVSHQYVLLTLSFKTGYLSQSWKNRTMRGFVSCYLGLNSTFYPSLQHSDGASVAEDVFPLVVVAFSTQLRLANSSATAAPPPPTQSNKPRQFFTNFPCSRFLHVLTLVLRQAYPTMTCIKCF